MSLVGWFELTRIPLGFNLAGNSFGFPEAPVEQKVINEFETASHEEGGTGQGWDPHELPGKGRGDGGAGSPGNAGNSRRR